MLRANKIQGSEII